MSSGELAHYGVKGMKWGVRRAEKNKVNPGYSTAQRSLDRKAYGKRSVKKINKRLNKGMTYEKARTKANRKRTRKRVYATAGAAYVGLVAYQMGKLQMGDIAVKAHEKRGQAFLANTMGLTQNGSSGPKASKRNRKGVYNISSM